MGSQSRKKPRFAKGPTTEPDDAMVETWKALSNNLNESNTARRQKSLQDLREAKSAKKKGDHRTAWRIIIQGCVKYPEDEDLWLQAWLLCPVAVNKKVLAEAVRNVPMSEKLWLAAAEAEEEDALKLDVLKRGLEHVPGSTCLWKEVVNLVNEHEATSILYKAVEFCPAEVDFWLQLARLESHENAKMVYERARKALPLEPVIWIDSAKQLEEEFGNDAVDKMIEEGIATLSRCGMIDREWWLGQAQLAEEFNYVLTCQAIIKFIIDRGVHEENKLVCWLSDAEECRKRGCFNTASAIYIHALTALPREKSIWLKAADLEKAHGTKESLETLLRRGIRECPECEVLWLMAAQERRLDGDILGARTVLDEAFLRHSDKEEVWLAAFELEFENGEADEARKLVMKARKTGILTGRVWMKSAIVERELGNVEEERAMLEQGLKQFPTFSKLWLMLGQLEERLGNLGAATEAYKSGRSECSGCTALWISAARLEERIGGLEQARTLFKDARMVNPESPELWLELARFESRAGNDEEAKAVLTHGLRVCQGSGLLWSKAVDLAPLSEKKVKSLQAVQACGENDPYVVAAVARMLLLEGRLDRARAWLDRGVEFGSDVGDLWATYYAIELQYGTVETQKNVMVRCRTANPKHGDHWTRFSKALENAHCPVEAILDKVARFFITSSLDTESSLLT